MPEKEKALLDPRVGMTVQAHYKQGEGSELVRREEGLPRKGVPSRSYEDEQVGGHKGQLVLVDTDSQAGEGVSYGTDGDEQVVAG